jgi:hypothetical protein
VVYARTQNGRDYTFQVSGKLWRNSLIMEDRETSSSWSHVTGEGLIGPAKGLRLDKLPSVQTTWAAWRSDHPGTKVLRKTEAVTGSHYQGYFDDPDRVGMFRSRWLVEKMPGKERVWGAAVGPHAIAVTAGALDGDGLVAAELGATPIIVVRGGDDGVRAFISKLGQRQLRFERADGGWRDRETASPWDLELGRCTGGELAGQRLEPVAVTRVFWFAWSSFYPNTQVVE